MNAAANNIPSKQDQANRNSSRQTAANWFIFGIAVFVIVLFSYTGINKLLEYEKFVFQMRLAPVPALRPFAPILGWLVPLVELVLVVALYLERTRIRALVASLILMVSFQIYISWIHGTGLDLPCTCGGIISTMSWTTHFIFNAVIIALIAMALIRWKVIINKEKGLNSIH